MAQFPLLNLLSGAKRIFVGLQGKKSNGDFTDVTVTDGGAINVALTGSKAKQAYLVTPSDTEDLPNGVTAGLYIGNSGKIKVTLDGGSTVVFMNLASGAIHPIAAKRIHKTDTDAQNILAVY